MSKPNGTPIAFAEPPPGKQEQQGFTEPPPLPLPKKSRSKMDDDRNMWARIAYAPYFENTTMAVIVFNALWIGVDTEWNHANLADPNGKLPLEPVSIVIENLFCVYFSIELAIRFLAFDPKKDCMFDAWFVFDSVLVACMIFETWIMVIVEAAMGGGGGGVGPFAALRLLRLLRLARVGRLMKFVPELGKLVKGMIKAARSVVFILIFLVLVIYVFSIVFTSSFSDRETFPLTPYCDSNSSEDDECLAAHEFGEMGQDLFATMGDSFMSLFTRGVLGDNLDETVAAILDQSLILMWLFFIFLIITFATLLNMLIGVVCEVIGEAAAEEEENDTVNNLSETITDAFDEIDENDDGLVTDQEWAHIKENKKVRKSLASIGIEDERMEERLAQMQEMLFDSYDGRDQDPDATLTSEALGSTSATGTASMSSIDRQGLTVTELIQKVVDIRPDQYASALDLELLKAQVTKDQKNFKAKLARIQAGCDKLFNPDGEGGGAKPIANIHNLPGMPNMSNSENEKPKNNDASKSKVITLADVPTALLFEALKVRSPSNKDQIHR